MLKLVCDRCDRIIKGDPIKINPIFESEDDKKCKFVYEDSPKRDYCQECSDEIHSFMMRVTKKKDPDKPETEKPGRKILDKGKIMALHKAGWRNKDIADEMNCSQSAVSTVISSMMYDTQNKSQ